MRLAKVDTSVVTLLLQNKVDPNATYANDLTALMWAAGFGKIDTVRALLASGANPKLKDNRGKTAADIATRAELRRDGAVARRRQAWRVTLTWRGAHVCRFGLARPRPMRASRPSRAINAWLSAPAMCSSTAPANIQLVAKCTELMKSFSAGSFQPQAGSVMPKYLTGIAAEHRSQIAGDRHYEQRRIQHNVIGMRE